MTRPARDPLAAALAALLLLCALASPAVAVENTVRVQGIRCWSNEESTRVAVDLEREAPFVARALPADPAKGLSPRVFVDIEGADIAEEILRRPLEVRNGLLKVVRAGRFRKGVVRVVIDLERENSYRAFALPGVPSIIVDIEGKPAAPDNAAAADASPPESPGDRPAPDNDAPPPRAAGETPPAGDRAGLPAARRAVPAPVPPRIRVMLDPGHGGKDPGAIGPRGVKEKDVVLAIGRLVREKLRESGEFDVRMTRDSDVFIPLEQRTAMANDARADIFVSLHINASRNRNAAGYSTYVLSRVATDRHSLELAARENGVPVAKLSGIKFILDDISLQDRKNKSLRLAKTVNDAIVRNVRGRYRAVHDLGLKQAPFYVLVGARMTAVLVESSFISNPEEESRLAEREHLDTIARSVVEAIRYFGSKGVVSAHASR